MDEARNLLAERSVAGRASDHNVRILSFGYDSRIVDFGGHASLNSLFNHSISLLNGLCCERERVDAVGFALVSSLLET